MDKKNDHFDSGKVTTADALNGTLDYYEREMNERRQKLAVGIDHMVQKIKHWQNQFHKLNKAQIDTVNNNQNVAVAVAELDKLLGMYIKTVRSSINQMWKIYGMDVDTKAKLIVENRMNRMLLAELADMITEKKFENPIEFARFIKSKEFETWMDKKPQS